MCGAVGTSATSAFARRRLDPGFARAWAQALEIGYVRLEAALVERAICFFEGEVLPDDNPIRSMSVAEAIQSLRAGRPAHRCLRLKLPIAAQSLPYARSGHSGPEPRFRTFV